MDNRNSCNRSLSPHRSRRPEAPHAASPEALADRNPAPKPKAPTRFDTRRELGVSAEERAAAFLESRGLRVLLRNFRRRAGEIDIVALEGSTLVIVEVRARSTGSFGGAAASVRGIKQARIVRAAQQLLQAHAEWRHLAARFDVVIIEGRGEQERLEWLRHAFGAR